MGCAPKYPCQCLRVLTTKIETTASEPCGVAFYHALAHACDTQTNGLSDKEDPLPRHVISHDLHHSNQHCKLHTHIYIHWDQIDWIQQKIAGVSHLDLVHWISGDPKLGYLGCKPLGVPVQPCLIFVRNKRFSACK